MAAARPLVQVWNAEGKETSQQALPSVFTSPIRSDVVQFVHTNVNKNSRQAYAVSEKAGHQTSAESWGTGRAVARIPRVPGGGTHRAGQAAFGNMCRGGRMFAPTKIWRKWHKRINLHQKRFAVCSALAASAVPALVMARGHVVDEVPEVPLVLADDVAATKKTSAAQEILAAVGAMDDVEKVIKSKKIRAGKGKARNRRYVKRRGPLVVYDSNQSEVRLGFRNLPGVELCCVDRLNLLQLAPGGHLGRFIIWSQSAVNRLDSIYKAEGRKEIPCIMSNADLTRIINSDEIQSSLIPCKESPRVYAKKRNPLKKIEALEELNPYAAEVKRAEARAAEARKGKKDETLARQRAKAAERRKISDANQKFYEEASKQGDVCKDGFDL